MQLLSHLNNRLQRLAPQPITDEVVWYGTLLAPFEWKLTRNDLTRTPAQLQRKRGCCCLVWHYSPIVNVLRFRGQVQTGPSLCAAGSLWSLSVCFNIRRVNIHAALSELTFTVSVNREASEERLEWHANGDSTKHIYGTAPYNPIQVLEYQHLKGNNTQCITWI